ncbi:sensor protein [Taylorella equigenitalis 14/56]|uniref:histidine kinase n=2 Tax=Taylorella equigenitalis TaxID=29575 RepID=I7JQ35_9BURK|nr:PAS domain-containing sensor histidine kinase [Taylorella equigenitalis]CCG18382.1 sensor protein [Taylorella equigenitalis 14/56]ASY40169.1 PAS domain-containing sensor histidine kinase [Taylorella equigenitalis]ASY41604.1 PAS domain-containing sensor histidine kinase [Taylorella equigenitalis]KGK33666.1 nitrogen regulation protein ntrY [Taylorella equigenitalis]
MGKISNSSLSRTKKFLRNLLRFSLMVAVILSAVLLYFLFQSSGNESRFENRFDLLMLFNATLAIALFIWLLSLIIGIVKQVKQKRFGARLTSKLIFFFTLIAIVPGVVVYVLSTQYVSRYIESWFNNKVDSALSSGIYLGQSSLDAMIIDQLSNARNLSDRLYNVPEDQLSNALNSLRENFSSFDLLVFSSGGNRVIAFSSSTFGSLLPKMPPNNVMSQLRISRQYASAEESLAVDESGMQAPQYILRVIVPIFSSDNRLDGSIASLREPNWLQLTRLVPASMSENLKAVQTGYQNYQELNLSRQGILKIFSITMIMALLLTTFASLAIVLWMARRLVEPLLTLAEGTQAVAAGDYRSIPDSNQSDELGQLSRSFNLMVAQLTEARSQVDRHRRSIEQSNDFLEGVLAGLTNGVIVLDSEFRITRVNKGAQNILHEDLDLMIGQPMQDNLSEFGRLVKSAFVSHAAVGSLRSYWQEQIELDINDEGEDKKITLLLRGTKLMTPNGINYLLVFDDISEVISLNRSVAWGEVARRLAHEIKNPLTPISLSAERIKYKLIDKLDEDDAKFLDRLTTTIVNQVVSLKTMVDDFREYARTPPAQFQSVNVEDLLMDIAHLYGWSAEGYKIEEESLDIAPIDVSRQIKLDIEPDMPLVLADPTQLRQVFNNLLSNSRDAMENMELSGSEPGVTIRACAVQLEDGELGVKVEFLDRGPGFPAQILQKAFEPYVTTKAHGTGLGLAIVRKIIDEHQGKIDITNRTEGGAKISILLTRIVKN